MCCSIPQWPDGPLQLQETSLRHCHFRVSGAHFGKQANGKGEELCRSPAPEVIKSCILSFTFLSSAVGVPCHCSPWNADSNFCVLGVVLSVRPSTLRPGNELCPVRHPPKLPFNKAGITVWTGSTPFFPSDLTVPSFPAAIQLRYRWDIAMDVFLSCLQISVFSHLTKL